MNENRLICQTELKEMGFNKKLIETLLPAPILKTNPRYKCAAKMKLWSEEDVQKAMQKREFADEQVKIKKSDYSAISAHGLLCVQHMLYSV